MSIEVIVFVDGVQTTERPDLGLRYIFSTQKDADDWIANRAPVIFPTGALTFTQTDITAEIGAKAAVEAQTIADYKALLLKIKSDVQNITTAGQIKALLIDILKALRF